MQQVILPWNQKNWNAVVKKLVEPIKSIADFEARLMPRQPPRFKPNTISAALENYFKNEAAAVKQDEFLGEILPLMQKLIKDGPIIFKNTPVTVLGPRVFDNFTYTRVQCASLISCMFFSLFPKTMLTRGDLKTADMPVANLTNIYVSSNIFPLQCIMFYFQSLLRLMDDPYFTAGRVILRRNHVDPPEWRQNASPLSDVVFCDGNVDASTAHIIKVSASPIIGGSELFLGTPTQECLAMLTRPESLIALLCVGKLHSDVFVMMGLERMIDYTGISSSVKFSGAYHDPAALCGDDEFMVRQTSLVFIDASTNSTSRAQLRTDFDRDLAKAYAGFRSVPVKNAIIATGNWSHGRTGSNVFVKFIQQLLAASACGFPLAYYSTEEYRTIAESFMQKIEGRSVAELYTEYKRVVETESLNSNDSVFDYINFEY